MSLRSEPWWLVLLLDLEWDKVDDAGRSLARAAPVDSPRRQVEQNLPSGKRRGRTEVKNMIAGGIRSRLRVATVLVKEAEAERGRRFNRVNQSNSSRRG